MKGVSFFQIFILIDLTLLAALTVLWRRRGQQNRKLQKKGLKKNIMSLREEKIKIKSDKKLSTLRSKLFHNPVCYDVRDDSVTKSAKEMAISKGELYLAARIKSYDMAKACSAK